MVGCGFVASKLLVFSHCCFIIIQAQQFLMSKSVWPTRTVCKCVAGVKNSYSVGVDRFTLPKLLCHV